MSWRSLTGIFTHDLKNKGFALFFAVTIWYFAWNSQIRNSESRSVRFTVQVESAKGESPGYELVRIWTVRQGTEEEFTGFVKVVLSGPQRDIDELNWDQVSGTLTIRPEEWPESEGYRMGQVRLTGKMFHTLVRSLTVVEGSITPDIVYFQLSPIVVKPMPVKPQVTGRPPESYRFRTKEWREVKPPSLYVRGPDMYFSFYELVADEVDVTNVTPEGMSYTETVPVRLQLRKDLREDDFPTLARAKEAKAMVLVDENGTLLGKDAAKVQVTVYFEHEVETREVLKVKLWALVPLWGSRENPFALRCDPSESEIMVTFAGPKTKIDLLKTNYEKNPENVGLYFMVRPAEVEKLGPKGGQITKTLDELKWDPSVIPGGIKILPAPGAPGAGPGRRVIRVELVPLAARKQ